MAQKLLCHTKTCAVPFKSPGPGSAAYTCGLCLVISSLRRHPNLAHLSITVLRGEYLDIMAQGMAAAIGGLMGGGGGGGGITSVPWLWGRVLASLAGLVQVHKDCLIPMTSQSLPHHSVALKADFLLAL